MAQIPYANSNGVLTAQVDIPHACNVFLVNSNNYRRYSSGQNYEYFGGHYDRTPVTITVEGAGRWYLIVECNGRYQYNFY
ncbi:hypothetical protein CN586_25180 [Bacillus toyonensis]|uniref:DUF1883 domain-containing protein n=1 Tax=Bacillus toyonensis TaxID=155322 RepID=UPI000BEF275A|nr:DUF1883 domain-containing protein [Bacillus toyonensis]PEK40937.1 hypothetical protein CN586_25180 [Bacillus toyonensis]